MGPRGPVGKPGRRGGSGVRGPRQKDTLLDTVMTQFEDVYNQIRIQTQRMAQIQAQVDLLAAKVRQLVARS
jgi:hypothetical protein